MSEVAVREVRPGDGEGCARAWTDAGRYYTAVVPEVIQEPDPDGLVEWFERGIAESRGEDTLWLVATADRTDGRVVGMIEAVVQRPHPDGRWQLQRDQSRTRMLINALAVADYYRRRGVGTVLMNAAEEWGRGKGADPANFTRPLASSGETGHRPQPKTVPLTSTGRYPLRDCVRSSGMGQHR